MSSIQIHAEPAKVFDVIADFGTWSTWSPWLIAEPEAKVTVSPDSRSVGAVYRWEGAITGEGEVEHQRLDPGRMIEDELRFIKPFKSTCQVYFSLTPEKNGTHVSWTMDGSLPWFLFFLIPVMKTFIGMDFQRGLAMLKDWIETGSIPSKTIVHGIEGVGPVRMAGIVGSCGVTDVNSSLENSFEQADSEFKKLRWSTDQPMITVYTKFRVKEKIFEYVAGYMIPESANLDSSSKLKIWSSTAGKAFRVEHVGSYRHLGNGWSVANQIVRYKKLKQRSNGTYEIYRTTPPQTHENELSTDIYLPLK